MNKILPIIIVVIFISAVLFDKAQEIINLISDLIGVRPGTIFLFLVVLSLVVILFIAGMTVQYILDNTSRKFHYFFVPTLSGMLFMYFLPFWEEHTYGEYIHYTRLIGNILFVYFVYQVMLKNDGIRR